jgi:hypothetical protein
VRRIDGLNLLVLERLKGKAGGQGEPLVDEGYDFLTFRRLLVDGGYDFLTFL